MIFMNDKMEDWNYYNWNASVRSANFLAMLKDVIITEKDRNECLQKIKYASKGNIDIMSNLLYESIVKLQQNITLEELYNDIDTEHYGLNHRLFDDYIELEKKEINKIENPQEVKEGGFYTCYKCKGTKTMYFSRQVRRADEPPSIFIFCMNQDCKFTWRDG